MNKEWHMLSSRSANLSVDKNLKIIFLKTLKILSCISKSMWPDLLTVEINYGSLLDGRIIIKVEAKFDNILI
jgi:hypothetical protein